MEKSQGHQAERWFFAEFITGTIAFPMPHRQYVFSLPIMLRVYFRNNRQLLKCLHPGREARRGKSCSSASSSPTRWPVPLPDFDDFLVWPAFQWAISGMITAVHFILVVVTGVVATDQ